MSETSNQQVPKKTRRIQHGLEDVAVAAAASLGINSSAGYRAGVHHLALGIDEAAARTRLVLVLRRVRQKPKIWLALPGCSRIGRGVPCVWDVWVWGSAGRKTPSRSTG